MLVSSWNWLNWHLENNGPVYKGANHILKAISDRHLLPNQVPKELCVHKSSESGFLGGSLSQTLFFVCFKSPIWKSFAFTKGNSGFQMRKGSESRSETASGTWFSPLWAGPLSVSSWNWLHWHLKNKSVGVFTWTRITFRKTFQNVIQPFPDLKAWF